MLNVKLWTLDFRLLTSSKMTITLLQQDIIWGNPQANQEMAEKAILSAPHSDLYVLPEMWSTGFATRPEGIAEHDNSSLIWMQQIATRLDAAIAGSIAVAVSGEEGKTEYRNRFYFVRPDESAPVYYDKHHLFTYGGEHHHYTPGTDRVIVTWRGVRFLLQVCYDLRFPIFARNYSSIAQGYDVALYVASWPTTRRAVWDTLLHARAIENQCYVCGVNRVGADEACQYNGGTIAIDAYGRTIFSCPDDESTTLTFSLDMERLTTFRHKFPVLADRD